MRGRLDRILTQNFGAGVAHADPHPGHVHVTTDGDLVLPGPGPAGRSEHARQLRPGQAIRRSQHIAPGRCAMGCSTCPLTGRAPRSTTGNARWPGSGHRLSTERRAQRFAEAPNSRSLACTVTRPQSGHPTSTTGNEPQNGEEAGQGVCRATCSWRAEMTITHGRSQPGAVSLTRTELGGSACLSLCGLPVLRPGAALISQLRAG